MYDIKVAFPGLISLTYDFYGDKLRLFLEVPVNSFARLSVLLLCISSLAVAASPVARVTSASSFELDGSMVNVAGVPSWSMSAGDDVKAGSSSLLIFLRDGSQITLSPNAELRLSSFGGGLAADLITGSMHYVVAPGSTLRVLRGGAPQSGGSAGSRTSPASGRIATPQLASLSKFK